ncbi:DUF6191 domain-containing protein [Streptomyces minutiscleroticus]|uniref:Regulatory protein n=1 Tax=Streptomyces minutiscleroticus TaxID=68238 RepID=A0A918KUM6_9ACTN|nr:DUF6191 domain-containing protein [Streptomyces minutiscleroticus]GGX76756.1 hypothetical protein GCM10010358_33950 [Streptomyces minutiscleroticus]
MFNMFEELFAPGRKHTNDERRRLELTRVDLNDGDPGRGPIDLSSGKVVVRLPVQPGPAPEDAPADPRPGTEGNGPLPEADTAAPRPGAEGTGPGRKPTP